MRQFILMSALVTIVSAKAQDNGTHLFDESYVHEIRMTFQNADFWEQLESDYEQGLSSGTAVPYRKAEVSIDGTVISQAGVRQKGFLSNWGASINNWIKKPLKISVNEFIEDQEYDGVRKINLSNGFEDPSMMRDALSYKFMRNAGINASRTAYARVYLNNTYWGLYIIVEEVDKRSLKNWYGGQNNDGNLFKCINNTNLDYQGTNSASYQDEFELKTNEEANDWSRFIDFVDVIGNSGSNFDVKIQQVLNVNKYLEILAADIIMSNWDSYYDHGRNFFLYQNPQANKMDWIPWDYNLAFSDPNEEIITDYGLSETGEKILVKKIQASSVLRPAYFQVLCELIHDHFTLEELEGFITTTATLIRSDLNADPNKFFSIEEFDQSLNDDIIFPTAPPTPGLTSYISKRRTSVINQLKSYGYNCGALSLEDNNAISVKLYPNPFVQEFRIASQEIIERVEIITGLGEVLKAIDPDAKEAVVPMNGFAPGVYLVRVYDANGVRTQAIMKEQ